LLKFLGRFGVMKQACIDGDCAAVLASLAGHDGGVNGPKPVDFVEERPIHALLGLIPNVKSDVVFGEILTAAFSTPGLLLNVRNLDGFIAQSICKRGWGKKRIRVALEALAKARNVDPSALFSEVAVIGGHETSCLLLALKWAIQSRDVSVVRELVEMGARPDEKELALLGTDPDKNDELLVIELRGSKKVRAELLRIVNRQEEPLPEDAPQRSTRSRSSQVKLSPEHKPAKRHRGPRQYYK
jgi:hypothetical protein